MSHTTGPVDVNRLLDAGKWGGYQGWLIFLTALTIIFDGIDNQLLGVALPAIMQEWSAPQSAFAPVVSILLCEDERPASCTWVREEAGTPGPTASPVPRPSPR